MANLSPLSSNGNVRRPAQGQQEAVRSHFFGADEGTGSGRLPRTGRPRRRIWTSASLSSQPRGEASDLYAMLNGRFGSRWSSEVVEHKAERGVGDRALQADGRRHLEDAIRLGAGEWRRGRRIAAARPKRRCATAPRCSASEAPVEARAEPPPRHAPPLRAGERGRTAPAGGGPGAERRPPARSRSRSI